MQQIVADVQYVNPQVISIEYFESLLRRAGEIFNPANFQLVALQNVDPTETQQAEQQFQQQQQESLSYQQMQPPTEQPYNFYLPVFQYDDTNIDKLDPKSRKLENFAPPPEPTKAQQSINYYAAKPKKLPKKFNADTKQVNLNWILDLEKQALTDKNGELPKAVYLVNDERNRINFDDTFFGVDMRVAMPDNEPFKKFGSDKTKENNDFLNQGEEVSAEDDLMAAPTAQLSQINFSYSGNKES